MASLTDLDLTLDDPTRATLGDYRANSLWRLTLRRLRRQRSALVGALILGILVFSAIFAPLIAPFEPEARLRDVGRRDGPCIHLLGCPADEPQHLLGIDGNFRDVFSRVIYGARVSLRVGVLTVSFAIIVGTTLGAVAGYMGGWVDQIIMQSWTCWPFPSCWPSPSSASSAQADERHALRHRHDTHMPAWCGQRSVGAKMEFVEASRRGASHAQILLAHPTQRAASAHRPGTLASRRQFWIRWRSFIGSAAADAEWGRCLQRAHQVFSAPHSSSRSGNHADGAGLTAGDGLRDARPAPRRPASEIKRRTPSGHYMHTVERFWKIVLCSQPPCKSLLRWLPPFCDPTSQHPPPFFQARRAQGRRTCGRRYFAAAAMKP